MALTTQHPRRSSPLLLIVLFLLPASCDLAFTFAPPATDEELSRGLVVLYAGASAAPIEMVFVDLGLREANCPYGIQSVAWATPFLNLVNAIDYERHKAWAPGEAARLVAYMDAHPGAPVVLVGYSAGAGAAALVAAAMPADHMIDRVVMLAADLSAEFDVTPMLDRTRRGCVNYFSPLDVATVDLIARLGSFDRQVSVPAAVVGFDSLDPRLLQVRWHGEMTERGNFGGHFDFLFNTPWNAYYTASWVTDDLEVIRQRIIDESEEDDFDLDPSEPPNVVP